MAPAEHRVVDQEGAKSLDLSSMQLVELARLSQLSDLILAGGDYERPRPDS
jgi:hypothetical protein